MPAYSRVNLRRIYELWHVFVAVAKQLADTAKCGSRFVAAVGAAALLILNFSAATRAEELQLGQLKCPTQFPEGRIEAYRRLHDVLVVAEPQPAAVAKDTLRVVGRDKDYLCFGLTTVSRNYHQCNLMGVAYAVAPGLYLYEDADTKLRFTRASIGEVRVEPLGDGYKSHCGTFGVIDTATYTPEPSESDKTFCRAFASGATGIELVSSSTDFDEDHVAKQLKQNNAGIHFDSIEEIYRADIDNDGKADNVAVTVAGTARFREHVVYDDAWKVPKYEVSEALLEEDLRWTEVARLVRFKGVTYTIWDYSAADNESHVSKIDGNQHRLVCRFGYPTEAQTTTTRAADRSLCEAVRTGKVAYVAFDMKTELQPNRCHESLEPSCAQPGSSALADVDNDGDEDNVVEMSVSHGGGRGCGFSFLALADQRSGRMKESESAQALRKATVKWGACGGDSYVFKFGKDWYVENRYPEGNTFSGITVLRFRGAQTEEVCSFSVHTKKYVIE